MLTLLTVDSFRGINVLGTKSELEKALLARQRITAGQRREEASLEDREEASLEEREEDTFRKLLAHRASKIQQVWSNTEYCSISMN